MKESSNMNFLNELIEVFLHNLIYYIPSEIIIDGLIDKIEKEIPNNFFDELSLLEVNKGFYLFSNEDVFEINQRLLEKRLQLEENIFKLESKNKELTPLAFEIIIQKYYDQLVFFLFITEWLITNFKKYNKVNIHLALIGAFKNQHEYLKSHLNDCLTYFGKSIDLEKEYHFTAKKLVAEYIPNLMSRFNQIENNRIIRNSNKNNIEIEPTDNTTKYPEKPIPKPKVKKIQPEISAEKIEKMLLERVFNIKID